MDNDSTEISGNGHFVNTMGWVIVWFSVIAAFLCIVLFGKVDIAEASTWGRSSVISTWSPTLIAIYAGSGFSGIILGYLIAKVGNILTHLEILRINQKSVT